VAGDRPAGGKLRIDRATWLICGIVLAGIGFVGSMTLFTTVSDNSSLESDISLGLLGLAFAGVVLGVLAIMGWGPFGHDRVNTAGSGDESQSRSGGVRHPHHRAED
jgi:hypothetical protein